MRKLYSVSIGPIAHSSLAVSLSERHALLKRPLGNASTCWLNIISPHFAPSFYCKWPLQRFVFVRPPSQLRGCFSTKVADRERTTDWVHLPYKSIGSNQSVPITVPAYQVNVKSGRKHDMQDAKTLAALSLRCQELLDDGTASALRNAVDVAHACLDLDKTYLQGFLLLARALSRLGRHEDAVAWYKSGTRCSLYFAPILHLFVG